MSKVGSKEARSIIAMLLRRKRFAYEMLKQERGRDRVDTQYCGELSAIEAEAHNAAELARRILYAG